MARFRKDRTATGGLGRLQDSLDSAVRREARDIKSADILNGELISGASLSTTPAAIRHNLGRAWKGAFVVRSAAGASPGYYSFASSSDDTRFFTATASGAATVDIWVF